MNSKALLSAAAACSGPAVGAEDNRSKPRGPFLEVEPR